jgi:hypothetical protein
MFAYLTSRVDSPNFNSIIQAKLQPQERFIFPIYPILRALPNKVSLEGNSRPLVLGCEFTEVDD